MEVMSSYYTKRKLKYFFENETDGGIVNIPWYVVRQILLEPTYNHQKPIHAHWEFNPNANDWGIGGWCCSNCGYKNDILGTQENTQLPILSYAGTQYCGCCGAIMDEKEIKKENSKQLN